MKIKTIGKVLQKVETCKQVKGIATAIPTRPKTGGEQAGNPLFMGGTAWAEKER